MHLLDSSGVSSGGLPRWTEGIDLRKLHLSQSDDPVVASVYTSAV